MSSTNILALDIGGSKLMAASVCVRDGRLDISPVGHRVLSPDCNKERLMSLIDESIADLGDIRFDRIGVTIPGLADPAAGVWVYACFSGIRDFAIGKWLSDRYGGKPVAIDNDVNACALAEKRFGVCRDLDDFLWVTVSNGVGGGLILDGKIYAGHFGGAAEIGHFGVVDADPIQCGCGNFGCLEAEAAGPGIVKRYAKMLRETGRTTVRPADSALEVAQRARAGDETAVGVIQRTGALLGKAAGYAVNLMNLEAVVFGGGVMGAFDLLYPSLERAFRAGLFSSANPSVRLEKTGLGYNAGLAGAASLALLD